jgi:hypothetical protein
MTCHPSTDTEEATSHRQHLKGRPASRTRRDDKQAVSRRDAACMIYGEQSRRTCEQRTAANTLGCHGRSRQMAQGGVKKQRIVYLPIITYINNLSKTSGWGTRRNFDKVYSSISNGITILFTSSKHAAVQTRCALSHPFKHGWVVAFSCKVRGIDSHRSQWK